MRAVTFALLVAVGRRPFPGGAMHHGLLCGIDRGRRRLCARLTYDEGTHHERSG